MRLQSEPALKRLTRKLGAVIDITRTIDRNLDDGAHFNQNGEISYVFDTNVIQMFLEPYKNPRFAQVFHAPLWGDDPRREADINTQACLLAAEYLMSGALPGQSRKRWYMTAAHHREVERQIGFLAVWGREVAQRLRSDEAFGNFALNKLSELNAVLALDPAGEKEPFLQLARRQGWTEDAVEAFARASAKSFADRAIGLRSREACRLLAQDWILEPADQVSRYRTSTIAGHYFELEQFLKPTNEQWEEIRNESQIWRRYIALVAQDRPSKAKTEAALAADCDALALISWGNRQAESWNRRIVFVTGDRTLLDAARQRFVDDIQQRFFFVRPISHFAPVFNPTSANSVIAREEAFRRLQEVLEGAMVPLNLGLIAGGDRESRLRARDDFAVRVERSPDAIVAVLKDFFPKARDLNWVAENEAALDTLVGELRAIETLMLEAFPRLIAERLNKERERFLREAVNAGTQVLASAIDQRFESAKNAGVHFSMQLMADALEEFLSRTPFDGSGSQRAAVQVRLSFSADPEDYLDYASLVAWLKRLSPTARQEWLEAMSKHPERMFALVALLAFNLESWKDADRYAGLAARAADEALAADDGADRPRREHEYYEFLYLRAKSLRFRIADTRPELGLSYNDVWWDWMTSAQVVLTKCIDYHERAHEPGRQLRAISERAALLVAYCEWFAFGDLAKLKPYDVAVKDVRNALAKAIEDLIACELLAALPEMRARAKDRTNKGASGQIILAARRQFNSNIHATRLTVRMLTALWPEQAGWLSEQAAFIPSPEPIEWPGRPLIVTAYEAADAGLWNVVEALQTGGLSLALDVDVIAGLQKMCRPQ